MNKRPIHVIYLQASSNMVATLCNPKSPKSEESDEESARDRLWDSSEIGLLPLTPHSLASANKSTTMKQAPQPSPSAAGENKSKSKYPTCGCCVLPTKRRLATLQLSTQHYRRAKASSRRQFRWVETSPTRIIKWRSPY